MSLSQKLRTTANSLHAIATLLENGALDDREALLGPLSVVHQDLWTALYDKGLDPEALLREEADG